MFLKVENLHKSFAAQPVLQGLSLDFEAGTLAVLGRSGCGKTTLLKIIAGLLAADSGRVFLEGEDISGWPPQARGIVYLYQEALLFPHLNVFENIAFGLRLRKLDGKSVEKRTLAVLDALELGEHGQKMPTQLSGGQRQRVAFGRALIVQPKLLLLDEPFASLDVETRTAMQLFFKKTVAELGVRSIFVTHDLKEAVRLGDRFGLLENGRLLPYPTVADFIADERTGVRGEQDFWRSL